MDHIVRYHTADGGEKIEDVGSLDAAIARVETLRNDEGVSAPRLYREVKVEFRTYVRAQVVDDAAPAQETAASRPPDGSGLTPYEGSADVPAEPERPTASASSEPPAGSMPLHSQRPTTKVNEAGLDDEPPADSADDDAEGDGGEPRRTLFSRG